MDKRLDRINDKLVLSQYKSGFSYGTDAVLLASFIRVKRGAKGAEIGTGTGIIPLLLAYRRDYEKIYAFELQEKYALLAKENVERNGYSEKIEIIHDRAQNYRKYGLEGLDFVFMNPPYMKLSSGYLNSDGGRLAARHETAGDIFELTRAASAMLKNGGDLFIVYRPDRLCGLLCALRDANAEPKEIRFVESKCGNSPVMVLVKAQKDRAPGLKIIPPLVLYNGDGSNSTELEHIYAEGEMSYGK